MKKRQVVAVLLTVVVAITGAVSTQAAHVDPKVPVIKAKQLGKTVWLSWDKNSSAEGYRVYRCNASGGNRKLIRSVKTNHVKLTGCKPGKTYYYRVRGYQRQSGKKSNTAWSRVVRITVRQQATLKKLLQTAMEPVGSTMYVWGGGWNAADTGAGKEARTIGLSPQWKEFFEKQTSSYDYQDTRYQIHNGLDCSGFVGWCIYNIRNTKDGKSGYVMKSTEIAKEFAHRGWGTYTPKDKVTEHRAGDLMCTEGHVYIVVGQCSDGSVVLVHSSPPGVMISGTVSVDGNKNSEAIKLAHRFMKRYYPEWYEKYPDSSRGSSFLTEYAQMRWDISGNAVMTDPDNYRKMDAEQILNDLF